MRFVKRRRKTDSSGLQDARRARVRAQKQLNDVKAETPRYRALGESLRDLRESDPLGVAITATFRGGHNSDH